MNFVSQFVEFTKEYESPNSFWRWAAYATVAATLRNNVYFEHGLRRTYPNIFVVLLADSAEYRKSGPFNPVIKLLKDMRVTKIVAGRTSIQAILDALAENTGSLKGGSALLCAEELASFFVSDPALVPLLTDMYDFREDFVYKLRSGETRIKDLCITMLAASNEQFLKEVYTNAAVYGGLLGRTIMVKPDETRAPNSLLRIDATKYDHKPLIDSLNKVRLLNGAVTITPDAEILYDAWYKPLYNSYKKIPDRTGITQRMHTTVLKLAIVIAAAHYTTEINEQYMKEAIEEITKLKTNYAVYAMSSGKSEMADKGALLLNSLWESKDKKITREEFLRNQWHMVSAEDLDKLITTLTGAKLIELSQDGKIFSMTEKCMNIFNKKESV